MGQATFNIEGTDVTLEIDEIGSYRGQIGSRLYEILVDKVYLEGFRIQLTSSHWQNSHFGIVKEPYRVCDICDLFHDTDYSDSPEFRRMNRDHICFNCACWEITAEKENPLVIDGHIYRVGSGRGGGFGGRRFDIEYFDGCKITTNDLWHGGEIPDRWKERISDTAKFINGAGYRKTGYWDSSK